MRNFKKLIVWQKSITLTNDIYKVTSSFPAEERYGLTSQLRRAAVSVASNIAEGSSRTSQMDFGRFLEMALGSAFEVETQCIIASNLGYLSEDLHEELSNQLSVLQQKLNALINKVKTK